MPADDTTAEPEQPDTEPADTPLPNTPPVPVQRFTAKATPKRKPTEYTPYQW